MSNVAIASPTSPNDTKDALVPKKEVSMLKIFQSLRFKTIVVLLVLFTFLSVAFMAVLLGVFPYSFIQVESVSAKDSLSRCLRSLYSEFNSLEKLLVNNAAWDQSVALMLNPTPSNVASYVTGNFGPQLMSGMPVNFVGYYFLNGTMLFYQSYDFSNPNNITEIPLPAEFINVRQDVVANFTDITYQYVGYINYYGTLVLVAGSPIITTNLQGPSVGFALYGRFQDASVVQDLASRAQLCVTFGILNGTGSDPNLVANYGSYVNKIQLTSTTIASSIWTTDPSVPVTELDTTFLNPRQCWSMEQSGFPGNVSYEDRVQTFAILNDWNGYPTIFFRIDIGRSVLSLGITAMIIALAVLVVTLVIIAIVIIIFVERAVLYPVVKLTENVQDITTSGDVGLRVGNGKALSRDELGTMARCINLMLESLDAAQEQIKHVLERTGIQEQRSRAIMNAIPDFVICMLSNGIINHTNVAFLERFQYVKNQVDDTLHINKVIADMTVDQLLELSKSGKYQDGFLLTRYKDKIPVTISVSEITLFIKEEPTKAYVVIAKNNTEKNSLLEKLDNEKKRMQAFKQNAEFDEMMRTPDRRNAFKNFCAKEASSENINFLEAVEEYKAMKNVTDRIKKQQDIIDTFLVNGSQQVNLSATVMEREVSSIRKGYAQLDLFDTLDGVVRNMIIVDTFQRFLKLPLSEQGIHSPTEESEAK